MDCGCGEVLNDHGDPRHLTIADIAAAADASGISPLQTAVNILTTLQATGGAADVSKGAGPEQQFLLGIAYEAGPDPRIARGADGGRDYFEPAELEKACWSLARNGPRVGLFHVDGTDAAGGAATVVENYIYRNPVPWVVSDDLVVKQGDWVVGAVLTDAAWEMYKAGKLNGWSPQGVARRRRPGPRLQRGES